MKVLIINGNPQRESLCHSLCLAYQEGAEQAGHEVSMVQVREMQFDPVLREGYHDIQELEPDLAAFQKKILWASHLVIVYPTWWGGMPALLKGLFDRSFLPGFAFRYHEKDPFWDKLLKGRSAHLITTMDAPGLWYRLVYRSAGTNMLRNVILKFSGISPVKSTVIGRVKSKGRTALLKNIASVKKIAADL